MLEGSEGVLNLQTFMTLLGGLGIFLFGIKFMGEALKNYAGDKMRDLINKYTDTPVKGVLVGTFSTMLIQSSSGTTALTISLVRAGLMDLRQAIGVIMGANIGTTITAFLIGLKIKDYALPIMFVGAIIYMFAQGNKINSLGQIFFGFGSLFFGLNIMSNALEPIAKLPVFAEYMVKLSHHPILGLLTGMVLTMIVQSSSATIGILQTLYGQKAISFVGAIPVLLGDNIGTTITAVLSAIGGATAAKRAATAHVIFNIFGAVVFAIILFLFQAIIPYEYLVTNILHLNAEMQLAFTHGLFNITVTLMLLPFVSILEKIVKKVIPSKKGERENKFDEKLLSEELIYQSPALASEQAGKTLLALANLSVEVIEETYKFIKTKNSEHAKAVFSMETAVNSIDKKLHNYCIKLSGAGLSGDDTKRLNVIMYSLRDYERISDLAQNTVLKFQSLFSNKEKISDEAMREVEKMLEVCISATEDTIKMFVEKDLIYGGSVMEKEKYLDKLERKAIKSHMTRTKEGKCAGTVAMMYVDILSDLERIGDHAVNIVEHYTYKDLILTQEEENLDLSKFIIETKLED